MPSQGRIGDADLATAEEAYQVGNMSRAIVFATRARDKLTLETPNGQRADDIMALSDPRNRPRGSRPGFAYRAVDTQH
jgi:predicted Zn-dependent protease